MNGQNLTMSTTGFWDKLERVTAERDDAESALRDALICLEEWHSYGGQLPPCTGTDCAGCNLGRRTAKAIAKARALLVDPDA